MFKAIEKFYGSRCSNMRNCLGDHACGRDERNDPRRIMSSRSQCSISVLEKVRGKVGNYRGLLLKGRALWLTTMQNGESANDESAFCPRYATRFAAHTFSGGAQNLTDVIGSGPSLDQRVNQPVVRFAARKILACMFRVTGAFYTIARRPSCRCPSRWRRLAQRRHASPRAWPVVRFACTHDYFILLGSVFRRATNAACRERLCA